MQTFLPYSDFDKSAKCLDYRRLGKMRIEARQVLDIITGRAEPNKNGKVAWEHHPAVSMWRGYPEALAAYMNACIREWKKRGYVNNMELIEVQPNYKKPPWIGSRKFHRSHKEALLFKAPEYYKKFRWKVEAKYDYVWPTGKKG